MHRITHWTGNTTRTIHANKSANSHQNNEKYNNINKLPSAGGGAEEAMRLREELWLAAVGGAAAVVETMLAGQFLLIFIILDSRINNATSGSRFKYPPNQSIP